MMSAPLPGLSRKSPEGEDAANLILHLYGCGYQTADGLKAMFDGQIDEVKHAHLA